MIEFKLDLKSGVPFHRQIVDQIRYGIASDRLMPGEQLPTVRELAVNLQVNPNTVRKSYSELEILGILDTQQGTGTFVSEQQVKIGEAEKERMLHQICDELVARGHQYGFTLREIVTEMQRRLENG
jgi:GntR family transcriptional regulator